MTEDATVYAAPDGSLDIEFDRPVQESVSGLKVTFNAAEESARETAGKVRVSITHARVLICGCQSEALCKCKEGLVGAHQQFERASQVCPDMRALDEVNAQHSSGERGGKCGEAQA